MDYATQSIRGPACLLTGQRILAAAMGFPEQGVTKGAGPASNLVFGVLVFLVGSATFLSGVLWMFSEPLGLPRNERPSAFSMSGPLGCSPRSLV